MKLVGILVLLGISVALAGNFRITASSGHQSTGSEPTPTPSPVLDKAPYDAYRSVSIGMPQAQAREKLGETNQRSSSGDFYVFSPTESAQVLWDKDQTVQSITVNYSGNLKLAPTAKDILGEDAKKEPDGSIYRFVRFPAQGFWVSYNRTPGNDATIVVTLQKMPKQ